MDYSSRFDFKTILVILIQETWCELQLIYTRTIDVLQGKLKYAVLFTSSFLDFGDGHKLENQYKRSLSSETYEENSLTVSVCGSYHRHLKEMGERIAECRKLGIRVLIPKYVTPKSEKNGFVVLRGENGSPRELQDKNFVAIENSSFVLVQDTNGYIGPSTSLEIGYAYAKGIPVFCTEKPKEFVFTLYTTYGKSLAEIKSILQDKSLEIQRGKAANLGLEIVAIKP